MHFGYISPVSRSRPSEGVFVYGGWPCFIPWVTPDLVSPDSKTLGLQAILYFPPFRDCDERRESFPIIRSRNRSLTLNYNTTTNHFLPHCHSQAQFLWWGGGLG